VGERYYVGADEAGRGSLVGEMIVAVAAVPESIYNTLRDMGVRDSKELTAEKRRSLYRELSRTLVFAVVPVAPQDIDRENLNLLTAKAIVRGFNIVSSRVGIKNVRRVVIDKFGDPTSLRLELRKAGYLGPLIIEEKADKNYPEVSAASIIAKHVRDSRIRVLSKIYGVEGSGYPSDPRTVAWLERVLAGGSPPPPIIRLSWGTLKGTPWFVEKKNARRGRRVTLEDFFGTG